MAGHAKKCVERYCELANKTTQQLYKCIDDHHFKEEEMKCNQFVTVHRSAAWLVLSGASAGGSVLFFVSSAWLLHAGDFWRTPVLADLPGAI